MRRLLVLLFALTAFSARAASIGSVVTGDMRTVTSGAFNEPIKMEPISTPLSNGTYTVIGPSLTIIPRTGTFSNWLETGNYKFTQNNKSFYIAVPGDGSTNNVNALATNGLTLYSYTLGSGFPGLVKATTTDTTPNVLTNKLRAGSGVTITTANAAGNAYLTIAATGGGGSGSGTFDYTQLSNAPALLTNTVYHNGTPTYYPTLNSAISAAAANDYIQAAPHVHTISNAIVVPVGATLDLRGATLNSYVAPLGTVGPTIIVRDNSRVLGGFVDLKLRGIPSADGSLYQAVIGSHRNVNTGTATNVWVYDNAGVGETDCIFVRNTNRNDIRFYSCNYTSKWDVVAFFEAAHMLSFFDTALYAVGTNSIIGSGGRSSCFASEGTTSGSVIHYYGGTLVCSNTDGAIITGAGGVKYELHNVAVTNRGTSTSFVLTTGDVLILDGTSVTSGEIDDDFGSGVALWRPGKYVGEFYGSASGLTNFPALGDTFPAAITNNETRSVNLLGSSNYFAAGSNVFANGVRIGGPASVQNFFGITNATGSATAFFDSPSGGGLGSIIWNGAWTFSGSGGITANQFAGSGAGLTSLSANSLSSGTVDPARLGYQYLSNGNSFAATMSNSLTFNDTAGNNMVISNGVIGTVRAITNSGNIQTATLNATGTTRAGGFISAGSYTADASSVYAWAGRTRFSSPSTTMIVALDANSGTNTTLLAGNFIATNTITATNGFRLPTNGIPANPVAGRFYSTNGAAAVTFGLFDSVPSYAFTKTTITVSNTTAATPFAVTFPGGTRATNGVPATFDVQGATEAIFEVYHNAQRSTNVVRVF